MSFPTPAPIEPSSESSSPEQPRGLRIVVAEDEALIRMDLVEMLAEAGYDVVGEAGDGEEAIAMVRELRPDLVLLDVKMPVLDGISAAAVIGSSTVQCRSLPRRVYDSCGLTTTSTYRSPAGPPPGPTSPSPASWIRVPVSTPAGTLIRRLRRVRTRPSPEHSKQGFAMTVPYP